MLDEPDPAVLAERVLTLLEDAELMTAFRGPLELRILRVSHRRAGSSVVRLARRGQMSQVSDLRVVPPNRVMHVMWTLAIGGAERALYQLVLAQRRAGIEAEVLVASDLGLYGKRLVAQGVPVETLAQRRGFEVAAGVRALSILSRCDAVHFHVAEPFLMLMAARGPARLYYTHRGGAFQYEFKKRLRYKAAGSIMRRRFAGMLGNTAHACDVAADLFQVPRERIGSSTTESTGISFSRSGIAATFELSSTCIRTRFFLVRARAFATGSESTRSFAFSPKHRMRWSLWSSETARASSSRGART